MEVVAPKAEDPAAAAEFLGPRLLRPLEDEADQPSVAEVDEALDRYRRRGFRVAELEDETFQVNGQILSPAQLVRNMPARRGRLPRNWSRLNGGNGAAQLDHPAS
jgi:hypothetical protein